MQSIIFKPIYLLSCMLLVSCISAYNGSNLAENYDVYNDRLVQEYITPEGMFILLNWMRRIPSLDLNHGMEFGTNGIDETHIGELIIHGKEDPKLIEKICNGNTKLYAWWKECPFLNLSLNKAKNPLAEHAEKIKSFKDAGYEVLIPKENPKDGSKKAAFVAYKHQIINGSPDHLETERGVTN